MPSLLLQWWCPPVKILTAQAHKQTGLEAGAGLQHCHRDPRFHEFAGGCRTCWTAADDDDPTLILHGLLSTLCLRESGQSATQSR